MTKYIVGGGTLLLLVFGLWWQSSAAADPDIIARRGLHAHPKLEIYVKGEHIEIPENLGLSVVHNPVHTHDDLPVIHLEFSDLVRSDDVRLGKFFEVWGKDIHSFGENPVMTVNSVPTAELDRYIMRDGDVIELRYE